MKTNPREYWALPYIVPPTYELPTNVSPMERIIEELKELKAVALAKPGKKKRPAKKEKSTKPRREKKKPKKKDK